MASSARARPRLAVARLVARPQLVRSGMVFGGAIAVANALTAVTQLILARQLDPAAYSIVVTLFIAITVAGVPLSALQASVARNVAGAFAAEGDAGAGAALRAAAGELVKLTLPALVLGAIAVVIAADVFEVHRSLALAETAAAIVASVGLTLVWGGLQGTHRFVALSFGQVAFALLRLVAATAAAAAGAGVGGVMGAVAAMCFVTLFAGLLPLAKYARASDSRSHGSALLTRYSGGAAAALTLFAVLTTIDVVVARLSLSHAAAGAYAAASVAARGVLLIPTAIATVVFPRVATLGDRARERRHLLAAVVVSGTLGLIATAVLWAAGGPLVRLVFGNDYSAAGAWTAVLALAMTLYGIAFVYLFHSLSVGRTGFSIVAAPLACVQVAAFAVFHASGREIAFVQLAIAACFVVAAETFDQRGT